MTNDSTLVDAALFPHLIVKTSGRVIEEIDLKRDLTIGRAEENDLPLLDPKVSRHHARIGREGARFVVTDLGSANGTRVNGVRLTGPHTLRHGERILIGDTELTYQEPGRSSQDTVTSMTPPPGVGAASRRTAVQPAPPAKDRGRGLVIGLVLVAMVLLLAAVAVAVYLFAPGVYEQIGLISPASPTALVVAPGPTESAGAATPAPAETPVQLGTPVEPASTALPEATTVNSGVDPQEVDDLLTQAGALSRRGKFEEAIVIYEDLTNRVPDDARPAVGWAWTLVLDDEADLALPYAQRAVELDPDSADAAAVLARAYIDTGDKDQALIMAEKAIDLDASNAQVQAVLAEAYMINGETQAAVDAADLALVLDINNADAHRIRGWLYHVSDNDMGRAAGELQIAAGLQPELWGRRHELGLLLFEAEDYTTSILAFQDALGIRPKPVTYTAIGQAYYELGQYDQAKASFQQALSVGAEDADTYAWLAASLAQQGNCEDAEAYYTEALSLDADHAVAQHARAICQGAAPTATPSPTATTAPTSEGGGSAKATPAPTKKPPAAAVSGRIAFPAWNAEGNHYDVYVAQAKDGGGRHVVMAEAHQPAFSPDGAWLAVNGSRHDQKNLFLIRPNGSDLKKISNFWEDNLPTWSLDGKSLAYATTRDQPGHPQRIYVLDDVPFVGKINDGRKLVSPEGDVQGEYPSWTPDGRIVYKGCDWTETPQKCGLFIIPGGNGPFTQLTERGEDTAPAAFGHKIAFMSNRPGNWEIYVMNDDGSGLKRLTENAAIDGLPTWSPDGKNIAFVSNQGGGWAIWTISPDGSNRRKLFEIGEGGLASDWQNERISWAP